MKCNCFKKIIIRRRLYNLKPVKRIIKSIIAFILKIYVSSVDMVYRFTNQKVKCCYSNVDKIIEKAESFGYKYYNPYKYCLKNMIQDSNINLTLVVPIYNVEKYLGYCIQSLINQKTKFSYEVLLIDDGSTDGSKRICDIFSKVECKIKVFHQTNSGVASARNIGIENARGQYISFVDADDYINEQYVELLMQKAIETDADIVYCGFYHFSEDGLKKQVRHFNGSRSYTTGLGADILKFGYVWGAVYKKKLWEFIRFPNGYLHEDMMMAYFPFYIAKHFEYLDCPLYYYRTDNTNSLTHIRFKNKTFVKQLDQPFLAYSILEYMRYKNISIDINILKITIREMGGMTFLRVHKKYSHIAFELGCYTICKLIEEIPNYSLFLTKSELQFVKAFKKENYLYWYALSCIDWCKKRKFS